MRVRAGNPRPLNGTELVDDVEMASYPTARVLGPKPLQVQFKFRLGRVVSHKRGEDGLEGETDPGNPRRDVQCDDRFKHGFAMRARDDDFALLIGLGDFVPTEQVLDGNRRLNLQFGLAKEKTFAVAGRGLCHERSSRQTQSDGDHEADGKRISHLFVTAPSSRGTRWAT